MSLTTGDRKWIRGVVREMLKNCAQDLYDALVKELGDSPHAGPDHVGGTTCATYVHDDNDGARRNGRRLGFHVAPLPNVTGGSSVTPDADTSSALPSTGATAMNN